MFTPSDYLTLVANAPMASFKAMRGSYVSFIRNNKDALTFMAAPLNTNKFFSNAWDPVFNDEPPNQLPSDKNQEIMTDAESESTDPNPSVSYYYPTFSDEPSNQSPSDLSDKKDNEIAAARDALIQLVIHYAGKFQTLQNLSRLSPQQLAYFARMTDAWVLCDGFEAGPSSIAEQPVAGPSDTAQQSEAGPSGIAQQPAARPSDTAQQSEAGPSSIAQQPAAGSSDTAQQWTIKSTISKQPRKKSWWEKKGTTPHSTEKKSLFGKGRIIPPPAPYEEKLKNVTFNKEGKLKIVVNKKNPNDSMPIKVTVLAPGITDIPKPNAQIIAFICNPPKKKDEVKWDLLLRYTEHLHANNGLDEALDLSVINGISSCTTMRSLLIEHGRQWLKATSNDSQKATFLKLINKPQQEQAPPVLPSDSPIPETSSTHATSNDSEEVKSLEPLTTKNFKTRLRISPLLTLLDFAAIANGNDDAKRFFEENTQYSIFLDRDPIRKLSASEIVLLAKAAETNPVLQELFYRRRYLRHHLPAPLRDELNEQQAVYAQNTVFSLDELSEKPFPPVSVESQGETIYQQLLNFLLKNTTAEKYAHLRADPDNLSAPEPTVQNLTDNFDYLMARLQEDSITLSFTQTLMLLNAHPTNSSRYFKWLIPDRKEFKAKLNNSKTPDNFLSQLKKNTSPKVIALHQYLITKTWFPTLHGFLGWLGRKFWQFIGILKTSPPAPPAREISASATTTPRSGDPHPSTTQDKRNSPWATHQRGITSIDSPAPNPHNNITPSEDELLSAIQNIADKCPSTRATDESIQAVLREVSDITSRSFGVSSPAIIKNIVNMEAFKKVATTATTAVKLFITLSAILDKPCSLKTPDCDIKKPAGIVALSTLLDEYYHEIPKERIRELYEAALAKAQEYMREYKKLSGKPQELNLDTIRIFGELNEKITSCEQNPELALETFATYFARNHTNITNALVALQQQQEVVPTPTNSPALRSRTGSTHTLQKLLQSSAVGSPLSPHGRDRASSIHGENSNNEQQDNSLHK